MLRTLLASVLLAACLCKLQTISEDLDAARLATCYISDMRIYVHPGVDLSADTSHRIFPNNRHQRIDHVFHFGHADDSIIPVLVSLGIFPVHLEGNKTENVNRALSDHMRDKAENVYHIVRPDADLTQRLLTSGFDNFNNVAYVNFTVEHGTSQVKIFSNSIMGQSLLGAALYGCNHLQQFHLKFMAIAKKIATILIVGTVLTAYMPVGFGKQFQHIPFCQKITTYVLQMLSSSFFITMIMDTSYAFSYCSVVWDLFAILATNIAGLFTALYISSCIKKALISSR